MAHNYMVTAQHSTAVDACDTVRKTRVVYEISRKFSQYSKKA